MHFVIVRLRRWHFDRHTNVLESFNYGAGF
jgi:hypothetical protein